MTSTKETLKPHVYYYGFDETGVQRLKEMKYEQAIAYKILASKALLHTLLDVNMTKRDNSRIHDVYKAIEFNTKLLEEIK